MDVWSEHLLPHKMAMLQNMVWYVPDNYQATYIGEKLTYGGESPALDGKKKLPNQPKVWWKIVLRAMLMESWREVDPNYGGMSRWEI